MPVYTYKAVDGSGKVIRSVMEADSQAGVAAFLQNEGLIPLKIFSGSNGVLKTNNLLSLDVKDLFRQVGTKDVMRFTQDLTALLEAGLPVDRSLAILSEATPNKAFKQIVKNILKSIEGGSDLSDAFVQHPNLFSDFYVNMVRAGEVGGVLEKVLERLGIFLETSQELKDYIKSSMIYPLFLVSVGGVSIIVLMTFVIPKFSVIFSNMGSALPVSTKILLSASDIFRHYWWLIGLVGIGIGSGTTMYFKTSKGKSLWDKITIRLPFIGETIKKIEMGRISRTLGTLIDSGVPILQAISLTKNIIGNKVLSETMTVIYDRVKDGDRLSVPLAQSGMFPTLAVHMIKVGEETGNLSGMLLRVADNYEKEIKSLIKRLVNLLEPCMILLLGIVVGFIVISMLMAIFSMNDMPL